MPRDGSATKAQILTTAMRLFVEQGYDKTSLREIADEVGVTKAALYYHFRTKEDLVTGAFGAYGAELDAIADWARTQQPGPERDAGFVDRLVAFVDGPGRLAIQFGQANPTALARSELADAQLGLLRRLRESLTGPAPDAESAVRATLAYAAIVLVTTSDAAERLALPGTAREQRAAARSVAIELLAPLHH